MVGEVRPLASRGDHGSRGDGEYRGFEAAEARESSYTRGAVSTPSAGLKLLFRQRFPAGKESPDSASTGFVHVYPW